MLALRQSFVSSARSLFLEEVDFSDSEDESSPPLIPDESNNETNDRRSGLAKAVSWSARKSYGNLEDAPTNKKPKKRVGEVDQDKIRKKRVGEVDQDKIRKKVQAIKQSKAVAAAIAAGAAKAAPEAEDEDETDVIKRRKRRSTSRTRSMDDMDPRTSEEKITRRSSKRSSGSGKHRSLSYDDTAPPGMASPTELRRRQRPRPKLQQAASSRAATNASWTVDEKKCRRVARATSGRNLMLDVGTPKPSKRSSATGVTKKTRESRIKRASSTDGSTPIKKSSSTSGLNIKRTASTGGRAIKRTASSRGLTKKTKGRNDSLSHKLKRASSDRCLFDDASIDTNLEEAEEAAAKPVPPRRVLAQRAATTGSTRNMNPRASAARERLRKAASDRDLLRDFHDDDYVGILYTPSRAVSFEDQPARKNRAKITRTASAGSLYEGKGLSQQRSSSAGSLQIKRVNSRGNRRGMQGQRAGSYRNVQIAQVQLAQLDQRLQERDEREQKKKVKLQKRAQKYKKMQDDYAQAQRETSSPHSDAMAATLAQLHCAEEEERPVAKKRASSILRTLFFSGEIHALTQEECAAIEAEADAVEAEAAGEPLTYSVQASA